jgi:prepilin-type processing-associated H-X9-DG protein
MSPSSRRPANTLLELLVVIAILGVLVAILLPAIFKARAAADRLSCQNNLKQVGLALHAYHDSCGSFPPGFAADSYRYLTWMGRLLPFTEQSGLWQQTQFAYRSTPMPWQAPPHVGDRTLRIYACPSDPRMSQPAANVEVYWQPGSGSLQLVKVRVGLTSYLGVSGTDLNTRDGVFYANSHTNLDSITDGTSQTLMVGERPPSPDSDYGWWYAGQGQKLTGSADMVLGAREKNVVLPGMCPPGPYDFGPGRMDDPCAMFHFWSMHGGGANFVMADGSVHFLAYTRSAVLPALATRGGGEAANLEE